MPAHFDVHVERLDADVLVVPAGELDLATAGQLERVVLQALDDKPVSVLLDLTWTSFMDSVGLGVLVGCARRATDAGVQFSINPGSRQPARLLELSGVLQLFLITHRAARVDADWSEGSEAS